MHTVKDIPNPTQDLLLTTFANHKANLIFISKHIGISNGSAMQQTCFCCVTNLCCAVDPRLHSSSVYEGIKRALDWCLSRSPKQWSACEGHDSLADPARALQPSKTTCYALQEGLSHHRFSKQLRALMQQSAKRDSHNVTLCPSQRAMLRISSMI